MKKVSSCLWSVVGLVCDDWLAVFGAAWFLYILVSKASVPAMSCHGFMQGLDGPFLESLVIQLHSWLLVHSFTHTNTHTHTYVHSLIFFLQTCIYSVNHSLRDSLIHPSIHPPASQVLTNLVVRQISASHVNNPLLVHLICVDHSTPLSTPPFSCFLLPVFPLSIG